MDAIAHYFDHNASSPLCPEARDAMTSALSRQWGNPSSPHRFGHEARVALEEARADVAALIGAEPREITFVSGGTEARTAHPARTRIAPLWAAASNMAWWAGRLLESVSARRTDRRRQPPTASTGTSPEPKTQ